MDSSPANDSPKAILLDLDDTIIIDGAHGEEIWRTVCERFAQATGKASDVLYAAIKSVADCYWKDLENHRKGRLDLKRTRREIVRKALKTIGFHDDELADEIADFYSAEKELATKPIPGAIEAVCSFKKAGLRLGLVTNGSSEVQRKKISRFGLGPIFDFILIEGEFGAGKPHASVFTTAMEKLSVAPSETWMAGDDLERDIAGAQRAGIYSVWIDWRGAGLPASGTVQPNRIVTSLVQLVLPGVRPVRTRRHRTGDMSAFPGCC